MYARVTLFEIDTLRSSLDEALALFEKLVLPELQKQAGYDGLLVLKTEEGKGLLLSLWDTQALAEASVTSGFYDEQVKKFVAFYKEPPGREHYEVAWAQLPRALSVDGVVTPRS